MLEKYRLIKYLEFFFFANSRIVSFRYSGKVKRGTRTKFPKVKIGVSVIDAWHSKVVSPKHSSFNTLQIVVYFKSKFIFLEQKVLKNFREKSYNRIVRFKLVCTRMFYNMVWVTKQMFRRLKFNVNLKMENKNFREAKV